METTLETIPEEIPSAPSRLWMVLVTLIVIALIVVSALAFWQRTQSEALLNAVVESCEPAYLRNMDTTIGTGSGLPTIGQPMSAEALAAAITQPEISSGASACSVVP